MDLQGLYKTMNVSHLSIDEVEYELLVRNILFHFDDHESTKRRKLKEKMKQEKEAKKFVISQNWRKPEEEISTIGSNLKVIAGLLENPKIDTRQRQKLKTRLVHYRVRIYLLTKASGAEKFRNEIIAIGRQASEIFTKYYSDFSDEECRSETEILETDLNNVLEEVRGEIEVLNETTVSGKEIEEQLEKDEAIGNQSLEVKKKEMNDSLRRSEELLKELKEIEEGKKGKDIDLISLFKTFVLQTTEQQRLMRKKEIEEEERKIKEAGENIERKKRLERLLVNLNDHLKKEPEVEEKPLPPGREKNKLLGDQRKEKNKINVEERKKDSKNEKKEKVEQESEDSSRSSEEKSSEDTTKGNKQRHKSKKSKIAKKKRDRSSKRQKRKHQRRQSFSSTSSTTSNSESSDCTNSDSSDSSEPDNRKGKGRRDDRRFRELKRIPVAEWKLKYDGRDQGRKLTEFLKEIKMRCISEDISERELFRGAIHLFSGRAKDWFIEGVENRDFRNWHELKRELKREFLPPDLDFQLEVQATERRQARGEKFTDYLHDMMKIFHSMTRPISERRKFDIIWRNLRFDYKNAMTGAGVRSLSKLKRYGRLIDENFWSIFQKSHETPHRRSQVNEVVATDSSKSKGSSQNQNYGSRVFSKSKPKNENVENNKKSGDGENKQLKEKKEVGSSGPMEGSAKGTMQTLVDQYRRPPIGVCYNCRVSGHHYADCPERRGKFCRICGFSDVMTNACPVCQKNGINSA